MKNTVCGFKERKIRDVWNAFMVEDAIFDNYDIPFCPTTMQEIPKGIIRYSAAKTLYNKFGNGLNDDRVVCFYLDDYKFDGKGESSIWNYPERALKILEHFAGAITPDFSTYQDFPEPIKIMATYKMRAFGYWLTRNDFKVVNNVRWGTEETYRYSFRGIPKNSIVCIGTVGGSPRKIIDRERFNYGFLHMLDELTPRTILVYGSSNYDVFDKAKDKGIRVVEYKSETALAYAKGVEYEQRR